MRALIVEDDIELARVLSLELTHAGWDTAVMDTGRDGLASAIGSHPDAVLLDLTLPDLDGLEICRTLRRVSDVPVIMLTARGDVQERIAGLDAGADDYLVKPVAPAELLARLRAVLRRPRQEKPTETGTLQAGDLTLDTLRRTVRRNAMPISLTRREFDLLTYLMQNPGIVLTRDMILEHVWGWGFGGQSNIVDVYMGYLRQKIDREGHVPLLHTVRGVGYALRPPGEA